MFVSSAHPVVFGGSNLKYSAEYPAALREYVEAKLGGECIFHQGASQAHAYVQGAAADIAWTPQLRIDSSTPLPPQADRLTRPCVFLDLILQT